MIIWKTKITFLILIVVALFGCRNQMSSSWESDLLNKLNQMADSLSANLQPWEVPDRIYRVEDFGAIPGESQLNTVAIQKAIDKCSADGGGVVLFSGGDYVTGTIELKSGVMLEVAEGSRILGSTSIADYPKKIESFRSIMNVNFEFHQSLIYAEKAENIGIRGMGEIYFRGEKANFSSPQTIGKIDGRPFGIRMIECNNVVIQDILLSNSAAWMQNYVFCTNLIFDGMKVVNHANYNNDGLDIDGCVNVIVRNCFINSEDDAMCLKGGSGKPTRNILIENSTFYSTCNALKIGTDTQGDFYDILVRNVVLGGIPNTMESISGHQASTGITLATVDGGNVRDIVIHDVIINQARCPIFLRIGNRMRLLPEWPNNGPGSLHQILIENVTGENNFRQGSFISGIAAKPIEDITIRNVSLEMEAITESVFAGLPVDENEGGYPDAHQFSVNGLPSYGFYIRHAKNIKLENVDVSTITEDARPFAIASGYTHDVLVNGQPIENQVLLDFSHVPQWIQKVAVTDTTINPVVLKYRVGTKLFSDRSTMIMKSDSRFQDAEYIQWPIRLRDSGDKQLLELEIAQTGDLYVAHDPFYVPMEWLVNGFEKQQTGLKIDNWNFDLYKKTIEEPQTLVLGGNHQGDLPVSKGQNYVVIFAKN
jgi:polygalacturonase